MTAGNYLHHVASLSEGKGVVRTEGKVIWPNQMRSKADKGEWVDF